MKVLKGLFRIVLIVVIIAVASAWLQDRGISWADVGRYILEKGSILATKIGQDVISMDWSFKK